jgi:hypothetical protein
MYTDFIKLWGFCNEISSLKDFRVNNVRKLEGGLTMFCWAWGGLES